MTTQLFAGERLEHPAIARTLDISGAIRFAITGPLDREAAAVLGRMVRIDLLAARGAGRRQAFVLDCERTPDIEPRALDSLKSMTRLVMEEMGSVVFENVDEDLYKLLDASHYTRVFQVQRA
jgi:ABC-type transporter Mla MlaB component